MGQQRKLVTLLPNHFYAKKQLLKGRGYTLVPVENQPLRLLNFETLFFVAVLYLCQFDNLTVNLTDVGVVVQWLDYLAVTQEHGVRFPAADKEASNVAPP